MTRPRSDLSQWLRKLRGLSLGEDASATHLLLRKLKEVAHMRLRRDDPLRERLESDDVAQSVIFKLCVREEPLRVDSWDGLFRILRRLVSNEIVDLARFHRRRKRGLGQVTLADIAETQAARSATPSSIVAKREQHERDRAAVAAGVLALPTPLRQALEARLSLGDDYAAIARELGITRENARQRVSRALVQLRRATRPEQEPT